MMEAIGESDMTEITDLVMPILKKLQANMSALEARSVDISEKVLENSEKIDDMKNYLTYHMGVTLQHKHDNDQHKLSIDDLKDELAAIKKRV
jgi:hypothetical protein